MVSLSLTSCVLKRTCTKFTRSNAPRFIVIQMENKASFNFKAAHMSTSVQQAAPTAGPSHNRPLPQQAHCLKPLRTGTTSQTKAQWSQGNWHSLPNWFFLFTWATVSWDNFPRKHCLHSYCSLISCLTRTLQYQQRQEMNNILQVRT